MSANKELERHILVQAPSGRLAEVKIKQQHDNPQSASLDFSKREGGLEVMSRIAAVLGLFDAGLTFVASTDASKQTPAIIVGILGTIASIGGSVYLDKKRSHIHDNILKLRNPEKLPTISSFQNTKK